MRMLLYHTVCIQIFKGLYFQIPNPSLLINNNILMFKDQIFSENVIIRKIVKSTSLKKLYAYILIIK